MRKTLESILFLISFLNLLGLLVLLVMIPITMFAPARFTKPWGSVSSDCANLRVRHWLATPWSWLLNEFLAN